jgi:hypothetical protein
VLPETFPGIRFDDDGVCNFCRSFKGRERLDMSREKYRKRFEKLLTEKKRQGGYDAIMAYSGGKDSSYTLAVLKRQYKLSVLALTMDNGFVSPQSLENSRRIVEGLGVDHVVFKPRLDVLCRMFLHCAEEDVYARKGLERASTICTTCMGVVKFIALRMAIEGGIPFVVYGWSPGQAPIEASIFPNNPAMIRKMQDAFVRPMKKVAGDMIDCYFLTEEHFNREDRFPTNVSPLAFLDYDEDDIVKKISTMGWEKPDDTDPNSTNCLLNALGIKVHKERFQFHPYAYELANLVRSGYMERELAVTRLEENPDPDTVDSILNRLREGGGTAGEE